MMTCMSLFSLVFLFFFLLHCCFKGEPRLPGAWGDQQEHAGTNLAHFWRRPAADLHTNAKRLVSPLHELPGLQEFAQHAVRAVPRILETVVTCDLSLPSSFQTSKGFFCCPVTSAYDYMKRGLGFGPSQGSQRYCDLHLTEDTQVWKSPEGSTS